LVESVRQQLRNKAAEMLLDREQLALVDEWITEKDPALSRSKAIGRLIEIGLKAKVK
jgi:hypothetical protein